MSGLENGLYDALQIKACEQEAMQSYHMDEAELMNQAGTEAFYFMKRMFPKAKHLAIYCGGGNNGGDGYVLARLAHEEGLKVIIYQATPLEELPNTAQHFALLALSTGIECQSADEPLDEDAELIVDALLGTGLKGPVKEDMVHLIELINASGLPVLAIDVPSGLNVSTGTVDTVAIRATATITFIGQKLGMYTADGPDYCGQVKCHQLQLGTLMAKTEPKALLLTEQSIPLPLIARRKNTHKHDFGHVLIIGGGPGMPGACALAALAALRTGAGAVTIATHPEHVAAILPLLPEAMVFGINQASELTPLFARATLCVIGPGLGESDWAESMFAKAMTSQLPMVIDASALRLLAQEPQIDDNWILTPHPGEAASLLGCSTEDIGQNRFAAIEQLQQTYGGVVALKGHGSLIRAAQGQTYVCPKGNPGMASAGMGDVLSGIIAGFCAQGFSLEDAAKLGVWTHGEAGDRVAMEQGAIGMLARDLMPHIPMILSGRAL